MGQVRNYIGLLGVANPLMAFLATDGKLLRAPWLPWIRKSKHENYAFHCPTNVLRKNEEVPRRIVSLSSRTARSPHCSSDGVYCNHGNSGMYGIDQCHGR